MTIKSVKARVFREQWNSQGLCYNCREHRPVAEGRKRCEVCINRYNSFSRERYARRKAAHKCVICGTPIAPDEIGKAYCAACRERQRMRMKGAGL